jgi:hypothetical protein
MSLQSWLALLVIVPGVLLLSVSIPPTDDAFIQGPDGINLGQTHGDLLVGVGDSGEQWRTLIRFDTSVFSFLKTGALGGTLTGAALHLITNHRPDSSTEELNFSVHAVTSEWTARTFSSGEYAINGDITWKYRNYPTLQWRTLGADFLSTPIGDGIISEGPLDTDEEISISLDITRVQRWIDQPTENYGLLIKALEESIIGDAVKFYSFDSVNQSPRLEIFYNPPANAGACCKSTICVQTVSGRCSGTFNGVGSTCSENLCGTVAQACCMPDGACQNLEVSACTGSKKFTKFTKIKKSNFSNKKIFFFNIFSSLPRIM